MSLWHRNVIGCCHWFRRSLVSIIAGSSLGLRRRFYPRNSRRNVTKKSRYLRTEDHMVEVIERLLASEVINLSVDQMAEKFSCSRRHLNRLFHLHFGVSVASLKMEMRLLKAISLLRDPDVKIIDVAEQCGFNHLGLFNTCFKRRFGLSPGRWRLSKNETTIAVASEVPGQPHCPMQSNGLCPLKGPVKTDTRSNRDTLEAGANRGCWRWFLLLGAAKFGGPSNANARHVRRRMKSCNRANARPRSCFHKPNWDNLCLPRWNRLPGHQ